MNNLLYEQIVPQLQIDWDQLVFFKKKNRKNNSRNCLHILKAPYEGTQIP